MDTPTFQVEIRNERRKKIPIVQMVNHVESTNSMNGIYLHSMIGFGFIRDFTFDLIF